MKKYLILVFILALAAFAWANPFGGPISGGGGGSGNATSITDDLIVNADVNSAANIDGSKLADNTIDTPKIKLNGGSGGYSLFLDQTNRINFAHYNNTGTRVIRIDSYDDGEIYLESEPAGPYISIGTGGTDNITVSAGEIRIMATGYDLSNTELSYLDNVASSIQTQMDAKASKGNRSFDMIYNAPTLVDNTTIKTLSLAVTILEIGGVFTDNTGTISSVATDNVTIELSFCASDNVVNCTVIDTTTIVGGASVFSDNSIGGTAVVPARYPIKAKFNVVNTTKAFMLTVYYEEN